ncbi:MAG: histidine kinase [Sphingobacteriales bacterium JAD_PAG50586_3]|nr:MAG: histidine kinase [Sphingobacteriales bacterium JAD_PAG50586_3]
MAEDALTKSLLLNDSTGAPSTYYAALTNLGLLYDETNRDDKALTVYLKAYNHLLKMGNDRQTGIVTNNIAHIYLQKNDKTNAEKYFLMSLSISKEQNSPIDIRDAALSLATLSSERGDYAKAFEFQQLAYAYNDTVTNADKAKAVAEVSTLYEVDKKEEENKRLVQIAQIKDLQITQQYIAIGAMAFALLFIVFGGVYFYRQRRFIAKQREKILEQKLLQMQLNPHFIFNSLIAIQDYIYNNNTTQAGSYLSKFAKLMRSTLENSRAEVIPLFKEIEGLENYLALQKLRMGNKLHYEVIVSDSVDLFTTEIPPCLYNHL